ncbi:MAG: arginyltransferase [Alphaproteobacteria bacterium]
MTARTISLFGSRLRPCPYLSGRQERNVAAELSGEDAGEIYDAAVRAGFRRSHDSIYRPACPGCEACVPVRICVRDFVARSSLARNMRRNAGLMARTIAPPKGDAEYFSLFARYQNVRHPGGGMDRMSSREFEGLMTSSPIDTFCAEFRDADRNLVGVMLTDVISDGLSAVYSFFDPDRVNAGLGTYMVLWLVESARNRGLDYVYLGYWIARSPKMAYKARFRPLEALHPSDGWIPFEPSAPTES